MSEILDLKVFLIKKLRKNFETLKKILTFNKLGNLKKLT